LGTEREAGSEQNEYIVDLGKREIDTVFRQ